MTREALLSVLAFVSTAAIVGLAGHAWRRNARSATRPFEAWMALLAGALTLYVWMLVLTWLDWDWRLHSTLLPLLVPLCLGLLALTSFSRRRPGEAESVLRAPDALQSLAGPSHGLGDGFALLALVVLGALLTNACLTMSDFVFHWGFKAHQWWLDGGIDFDRLTQPWNVPRHPDYPHLVPSLFVATTLARGVFTETPLIAWSLLFAAGAIVAAREGLLLTVRDAWIRHATLVIVAGTVTFMTITYRLGGSPDLLLAAVVVSAVALLLTTPTPRHDWTMGLIAAVAVGTKVEGTPFALLAITVYLARRFRARDPSADGALADSTHDPAWRAIIRVVLPPLVVALPWWLLVARHQLAAEGRRGGFQPDRILDVLGAIGTSLLDPAWHGLGLVLLLLPLALWVPRTRAAAIVVTGQLCFYAWVYLDTPLDAVKLVHTSAVRLMFHVWPATMVLVAVVVDSFVDARERVAVERNGRHQPRATGTISP